MFSIRLRPSKGLSILEAALCELDIRLSKGLANSGLHEDTVNILYKIPNFHESDVSEVRLQVIERNLVVTKGE